MNDEQLADQIRRDGIDILVDLTLHLAHNRLLVFARKPAPVQITFAGYPGSTGLETVDYRLSDPYLDPPDAPVDCYSERPIRLPDTFWCDDQLPITLEPADPPMLAAGHVTFGSLNNFCKMNDAVLDAWARVLIAANDSRLIMLAPQGSARERVLKQLSNQGVESSRIEFVGNQPRAQYLDAYRRIDIGLDTWPYSGHATSFDALWMGVPVITLAGNTVVGRGGVSLLSNLKMNDLIAADIDEFVSIATALAVDAPRLTQLHRTLRQRMRESPLTDTTRFARNVESVYRTIWQRHCESAPPVHGIVTAGRDVVG